MIMTFIIKWLFIRKLKRKKSMVNLDRKTDFFNYFLKEEMRNNTQGLNICDSGAY